MGLGSWLSETEMKHHGRMADWQTGRLEGYSSVLIIILGVMFYRLELYQSPLNQALSRENQNFTFLMTIQLPEFTLSIPISPDGYWTVTLSSLPNMSIILDTEWRLSPPKQGSPPISAVDRWGGRYLGILEWWGCLVQANEPYQTTARYPETEEMCSVGSIMPYAVCRLCRNMSDG